MLKPVVVLNPYASNGKARNAFPTIKTVMSQRWDDIRFALTESPDEVDEIVEDAIEAGFDCVISVGGDGTNNRVLNALMNLRERNAASEPVVYGNLPIGTGQDWARTAKVPAGLENALQWLAAQQPRPIDVGKVRVDGQTQYFLNISSVGIGYNVNVHVEKNKGVPMPFVFGALKAIIEYTPTAMKISVDGKLFYDGKTYLVAIANGQYFGAGMAVAPNASIDDGVFDVVLLEGKSQLSAVTALATVFSKQHLRLSQVHTKTGKSVEVVCNEEVGVEIEGELYRGKRMQYSVLPRSLQMLI